MEIKQRLHNILKEEGFDLVLLVSQPNVIYATEFEVPYWGGFMADMAQSLPMVIAVLDVNKGEVCLAASDFYKNKIHRAGISTCIYYECFSHEISYDPNETFERAVCYLLQGKLTGGAKVGVEFPSAPQSLIRAVKKALPQAQIFNAAPALEKARAIKTAKEIHYLEQAARAADAAQNRLMELSQIPGDYTELDVWFEVQKSAAGAVGCLVPFYGELVTGPNCGLSDYPLGPTSRKIQQGDMAIMDIGPRVNGYWSDCSNVVVFWEEPNEEQLKYFRAVKDAYEAGRDAIRPGVTFREVNSAITEAYHEHGFELCSYLGHQIGTNVNEKPRFTLHEEAVLEENMVVCIEPQLYSGPSGKTGVRLERMLHVTEKGARELNHFPWGIDG